MGRVIWFLVKLGLLVAVVGWFVTNPGAVTIHWRGYLIETTVGVVAAALIVLLLAWTLLYRLWRGLTDLPERYRRFQKFRTQERGYRAITRGLAAVAAGDALAAERHVKTANDLAPRSPLTGLLRAQSALLNGNLPRARREFDLLMDDRDGAFFGIRGLLVEHIKDNNTTEALTLMRRALRLQPKRPWVLRTLFDLEARTKNWRAAEKILSRCARLRVFDKNTALEKRQVLFLAQSDQAYRAGDFKLALKFATRAHKLNDAHIPSTLRRVRALAATGHRRKAVKILEQAWALHPHPALAQLWMPLMPPVDRKASLAVEADQKLAHAQRLYDIAPRHRLSASLLGQTALEARKFDLAREHLTAAADYQGLAQLERAQSNDEQAARNWLALADTLPPPAAWVCQDCGHVTESWSAHCESCHDFNTYVWSVPTHRRAPLALLPQEGESFLKALPALSAQA